MHSVYYPGKAPKEYDQEEYCPHCDSTIPVVIDQDDFEHYEFTCPVCGEKLMLCTLCNDDQDGGCDWTEEYGCFRMRKGIENSGK